MIGSFGWTMGFIDKKVVHELKHIIILTNS